MAQQNPIACSVITPEKSVLSTSATSVVIPAHDGLVGVLKDRAPLLCELGTGVLRVETPEGSREVFVDSGFAQVLNNEVTVLTERAALAEELSKADAEKALAEAVRSEAHTADAVEARRKAVARAQSQLRIAKK